MRPPLISLFALAGLLFVWAGLSSADRPAADAATGSDAGARSPALIVQLKSSVPLERGLSDLAYIATERPLPQIHALVVSVTQGTSRDALRRLRTDRRVLAASEDQRVQSTTTPGDPLFSGQWDLQSMQMPFAWERVKDAGGTIVAVLDSGVDLSHPDLAPNLVSSGCDVISDHVCSGGGQGSPAQDQDGHGSEVSGVIAAAGNNQTGTVGVAWNAKILPVRVTSNGGGVESDFITGLMWAVDQGARVVNLSFAEGCGTPETSALQSAIGYASGKGALLVAAAGNDGGCPQGVYPAADPRVFAVTSTDKNDVPGPNANYGPWVSAAAPGEGILSTFKNGQYAVSSGTSLAAPHVAGLAALLFGAPGATATTVRQWITTTCDQPAGWNRAYGCGRVNGYRAVSLAFTGSDPHTISAGTVRVHLVKGWNNVVYLGPTRAPDNALASITGKFGSVYAWDATQSGWQTYLPGHASASDLPVIVERGAYWLFMNADADLTMSPTGTSPPAQLTLPVGWNNVSLPAGQAADVLNRASPILPSLFAWDPGAAVWRGFFSASGAPSDLSPQLSSGAYWVYAQQPTAIRTGY